MTFDEPAESAAGKEGSRHRLFIGWQLEPAEAEGLHAWAIGTMRKLPIRLVPPENLHVTLLFFGRSTETDREALATRVQAMQPPPMTCRLGGPIVMGRSAISVPLYPGRQARDRLRYFVEGPDEAADRTGSHDVAEFLEAHDRSKLARRAYLSLHVTLARFRSDAERLRLPTEGPDGRIHLGRLCLFESTLERSGSRYRVLASSPEPLR